MTNIDLASQVAPMFHKTFNSKLLHQADKGGRGSTKTSKNAIKIWKDILENPESNVIVIRRYYKDNRKSTYRELIRAASRLGIKLKPKENLLYAPLQIKYGKANIYFAGLDDYESLKGEIPEENQINIIWFFEITQYRAAYEMQQAIATFSRGNPKYFYCLYEYNPHPNLSHWTYEWLEVKKNQKNFRVQHTTYADLPKDLQLEWLGHVFIEEAEAIKELDYEQYKSIYLGLPARLKGAIYKKFRMTDYKHELIYNDMFYSIGVDYGETDATTFYHTGFKRNMDGVRVHDEYYHKNNGVDQKDINDYCEDFFVFAEKCHEEHGKPIIVFVDSASKSFKTLLQNETARRGIRYLDVRGVNKKKRKKSDESAIKERINLTNLMLGLKGYLEIDVKCKELLLAMETVEYNDKGERIDDGTYNIDSLDAFEYSWLEWLTDIEKGILALKGVEK